MVRRRQGRKRMLIVVSGTSKLVVHCALYLQVGVVEELEWQRVMVLGSADVLPSVCGAPTPYLCGNISDQGGIYLGERARMQASTKAHSFHLLTVEGRPQYRLLEQSPTRMIRFP